ncbi:OmpA family protein, partial [Salibacteraceae bacterium]|nr:OmpA family protein [Salibacteraceae bacterium]
IEAGRSVVLKNVFFDTDKFDLKPASKTELNKLADLLDANPDIKIEVSGHTDNQGNAAANQTLSENRSKAVYQYLIDHGISGGRLMYKGYGQTKPIATNETDEGRALNRRTEFIVLE